jgi:hypothetical protein
MISLSSSKKNSFWLLHMPWIVALFIIGPFLYLAMDRSNPWIRISGTLEPSIVEAGTETTATFRVTRFTRYCEGTVQREIIDSQKNIFPKLSRQTVGIWEPTEIPDVGTIATPPVIIPDLAAPGPAIYRVQTFFYCNWLQKVFQWPIIQVGPDIEFMITKK